MQPRRLAVLLSWVLVIAFLLTAVAQLLPVAVSLGVGVAWLWLVAAALCSLTVTAPAPGYARQARRNAGAFARSAHGVVREISGVANLGSAPGAPARALMNDTAQRLSATGQIPVCVARSPWHAQYYQSAGTGGAAWVEHSPGFLVWEGGEEKDRAL